MSDSENYAAKLAHYLGYTNTFYHQAPRLDIQEPPPDYLDTFAFVISSDVLEHVAPPIEKAFENLRRILVPGGVLVLTVPFSLERDTHEHFPLLNDYRVEKEGEEFVLHNVTADGAHESFRRLVFHGGPGTTLEMRLFSQASIVRHLESSGFSDIRIHGEPAFEWGVYWNAPWSVPITAVA